MIELQKELDLDFIKFMPYGLYSVVDWGLPLKMFEGLLDPPVPAKHVVSRPGDWKRLKRVKGDEGEYAVVLEAQRLALAELDGSVPLVQTVFSPLTSCAKLAGYETLIKHLQEDPDTVQAVLEMVTETTVEFACKAVELGADGFFFATQMSSRKMLSPVLHQRFVKHYDFQVLEAIKNRTWLNILHVHGSDAMIGECLDYPVQVLNWHDRDDGPPLAEVRKITDKCLLGGVGHLGALLKDSPQEIASQIEDAWRQTEGRKLIIGPGCGANTRTPWDNVLQIKKSIRATAIKE
jgi:uroporphyrinogen decarboxylase